MKMSILPALVSLFALSLPLCGAEQKQLNVVDYFLRLPPDLFEGKAEDWLRFSKQAGAGVIDIKNGYMSCTGDGAQAGFQISLFRYRDGRPLLAFCSNENEGPDSVYLYFYELGSDGKMHEIDRSIFPVGDAGYDADGAKGKGNWRFELPRQGRTVLVRSQRSGKVLRKLAWNGEKFVDAK